MIRAVSVRPGRATDKFGSNPLERTLPKVAGVISCGPIELPTGDPFGASASACGLFLLINQCGLPLAVQTHDLPSDRESLAIAGEPPALHLGVGAFRGGDQRIDERRTVPGWERLWRQKASWNCHCAGVLLAASVWYRRHELYTSPLRELSGEQGRTLPFQDAAHDGPAYLGLAFFAIDEVTPARWCFAWLEGGNARDSGPLVIDFQFLAHVNGRRVHLAALRVQLPGAGKVRIGACSGDGDTDERPEA